MNNIIPFFRIKNRELLSKSERLAVFEMMQELFLREQQETTEERKQETEDLEEIPFESDDWLGQFF
jgi:hypothetical protein